MSYLLDLENASDNTCYIIDTTTNKVVDTFNFETMISFKGFELSYYGLTY
jgi:hypothetical protein